MKKNPRFYLAIVALLIPIIQLQQVPANAQSFSLLVAVTPTRTLVCSSTAISTSTTAGGTTGNTLGACIVSLVSYTSPYKVTVQMAQLTSGSNLIPFSAVSYLPGALSWSAQSLSAATTSNVIFSSTAPIETISVSNSDASTLSMSWTPALSVVVPNGQATGLYTATITHSLV